MSEVGVEVAVDCTICLEAVHRPTQCGLMKMEDDTRELVASCKHTFHRDCVVAWARAQQAADKRPVSTSRSRRKPNPRCPTCRAEFTALIQKEKILQVATLLLPQFAGGGGLNDLVDDSEEDESEDSNHEEESKGSEEGKEGEGERRGDKDLLREFNAHYRPLDGGILSAAITGVRSNSYGASHSSSEGLLSSSSVRSHTDRGSSRVASFIAEAQQRSSELDALLQAKCSSTSLSDGGVERSSKKRNLKSGLAEEVAAAVALIDKAEAEAEAEAEAPPPLAPPPPISDPTAAPLPRVRRKKKPRRPDQGSFPCPAPIVEFLPPMKK